MTENAKATVPVRVRVGAVKIHGPNSHEEEGTREEIPTEGPKLVQVTYDMAVGMFGQEKADELFADVPEEDR